jgi:hypothetical protein
MYRRWGVVIKQPPREDGQLSIVLTWERGCVLSDGRELLIRWSKLAALCAELCQERAVVTVRTWQTKVDDHMEDELITIRRAGTPEAQTVLLPTDVF